MSLHEQMRLMAEQSRESAFRLAAMSTDEKNACLEAMASALENNQETILSENAKDLEAGKTNGLTSALLDRLELTPKRFESMTAGLRQVINLPDPIGKSLDERSHPDGFKLVKTTTPLGVIVIIYESRPNVTVDAAGLCFKSGNATILRGGKEAIHSNQVLAKTLVEAATKTVSNFPAKAIQVVPTTDRAAIPELLSLTEYVDLCIPRGGEGLIRAVADCSKVPVIKHYKGICSVYVDAEADTNMAADIAVNAKTQRPGVCNAIENLLIARSELSSSLPAIAEALLGAGVELRCDSEAMAALSKQGLPVKLASEQDWSEEYLDLILSIKTVSDVDEAIQFINRYGSAHSDAIVTPNEERARRFLDQVDSSAVYWNVSTRYTDGGEFGMGAEIGISTDKVGARGPMGLDELASYKWIIVGDGQVRR